MTEDTLKPESRIVLAPDKFKGSLSAADVVDVDGSRGAPISGCRIVMCRLRSPTVVMGAWMPHYGWAGLARRVATADAWGRGGRHDGRSRGKAGHHRGCLDLRHGDCVSLRSTPLTASSFGVGLVIAALLDDGFDDITVGLGGSATTDGGAGMLGARSVCSSGMPPVHQSSRTGIRLLCLWPTSISPACILSARLGAPDDRLRRGQPDDRNRRLG